MFEFSGVKIRYSEDNDDYYTSVDLIIPSTHFGE